MYSKLSLVAAVALGVGCMATPAFAISYDLTVDNCTGGCGSAPFGTVTLTQNGSTVDVTVHLAGSNSFVKTGAGDSQAFKFNATDVVLADITVDVHVPGLVASTGAFNGDGGGNYAFGINCPTCGGGSSGTFSNDIVFHVANAVIADLTHTNNLGFLFAADILGSTGNTGLVLATPGPIIGGGLPGLLAACGGLIAMARRRRRKIG